MTIRCEIVTQEGVLFADEVDIVIAPGVEGEMGILPRHAPLLTALAVGELRVRKGEEEYSFAVHGGVLEVTPEKVVALADVAEASEAIDVQRAEEARARAEARLREGVALDSSERERLQAALRRSKLRLKVARRRRRRLPPPGVAPPGAEEV